MTICSITLTSTIGLILLIVLFLAILTYPHMTNRYTEEDNEWE